MSKRHQVKIELGVTSQDKISIDGIPIAVRSVKLHCQVGLPPIVQFEIYAQDVRVDLPDCDATQLVVPTHNPPIDWEAQAEKNKARE